MDSPFEVLEIDPDADEEAIESAYRQRVKEAHPDHGGSLEEFRAVRLAYEALEADDADARAAFERADVDERDDGADRDAGTGDGRPRATTAVTYLDYDVVADYGWGPHDADLFRKAADADLGAEDFGQFEVEPGESLLEAAERRGHAWPFACRGGACANCAILLREGELSMPVSHVLPDELMEQGFRLSCNGIPITDELEVVFNVKHMPELDDLLLPPRPFEQAYVD